MDRDKFNAIFNDASEAVLILDSYGKIIFLNSSAASLLGYNLSEIEYHSIFSLLDNKSYQHIRTFIAFKSTQQELSTLDETAVLIRKNGEHHPARLLLSRIAHEKGDIFLMVLEEPQQTTQTNNTLSNYQLLAEHSPDIISLYDPSFQCLYVNQACQPVLGYSPAEYLSMGSFLNLISETEKEHIAEAFQKDQENKLRDTTYTYHSLHKEGHLVLIENLISSIYDEDGHLQYLMAYERAIAPRRSIPTPSTLKKQLMDSIFNFLPDAVLVVDPQDRHFINCNVQALHLFEADEKDFMAGFGLSSALLNKHDEETLRFLQQKVTLDLSVMDVQYITFKGKPFWGKTKMVDIPFEDSTVRIVQISDLTQQKAQEEKLQSAKEAAEQTMRSREDFLSIMSHEIRTPLNAVLGMTHLMLQKEPREDQKKLLQTLKFAGENLTALINDILDYTKIEAGKLELNPKDFNLKEFIHGIQLTYKNLANEKGLIFRLLLEEELPIFVHGDVTRLGQILNNLLNNAIKFTAEGQIVVSVYVEEEQEEQYMLLFEVSDTGIGIPKDKQEIIFDPYQQASSQTAAKFGGTGLGLSIVQNLVTLQNGELSLQSAEGEGTTFKVKLPFKKPENPEHSDENQSNNFITNYPSLEGLKVLYVEDVIPNQLLMEGLCDHWKVDLDTALNGLEALEKVKKNQYDLILMDIQMPEKNGYETALEIRNLQDPHYENIPIIALSASISEKTRLRIREAGMDDYLPKPIDPKNLHKKLSKFSRPVPKHSWPKEEAKNEPYTTDTLVYVTDTPDFSQLHALYINDNEGYIRILEQIRKLTLESLSPIIDAVRHHNEKVFRFTCHKLMSYIRLLKLHRLEELIDVAKDYFIHQVALVSYESMADELEHHFEHFINKIDEELTKYN